MFKSAYFSARLEEALSTTDVYLPIRKSAEADLLSWLEDGDYTYAAIVGDVEYEVVKITRTGANLILTRGMGDTLQAFHHMGSVVKTVSPLILTVIKELMESLTSE